MGIWHQPSLFGLDTGEQLAKGSDIPTLGVHFQVPGKEKTGPRELSSSRTDKSPHGQEGKLGLLCEVLEGGPEGMGGGWGCRGFSQRRKNLLTGRTVQHWVGALGRKRNV